ncbi:MAG: SLC13 family permease [Rhodospirillaceae bacterium]
MTSQHSDTRFPASSPTRQRVGLVLGGAAFILFLMLPPPEGLSPAGWRAAAVAALMALWWITEAIPVYATGLLPLALFPLLDVVDIDTAAAPYANPLIFLFMGGFMIALAMQRWGLHTRIALSLLSLTGTRARNLIGGFMLATALLSMWVSNTATTMMMLPIAISVLALLNTDAGEQTSLPGFSTALVLAIAYAANIGGLATLIGTPPNALLAAYFDQTYGVTIGFAEWMAVGLPLSILLLVLAWLLLTRFLYPIPNTTVEGAETILAKAKGALGPVSRGELVVAIGFGTAAFLWVFRPLLSDLLPGLKLSDAGIAMTVALALFLVPSGQTTTKGGADGVLNWEWASKLPWGVLLLFGGGLSLAAAAGDSGLSLWIGNGMAAWGGLPTLLLLLAVVTVVIFLTEVTSNTATTATLLPLLAAAAIAIGENPLLLCIPAALAASCAFMLPPATPPNAIVFGSGHVTIPQMARAGIWLNIVSVFVLVAVSYLLAAPLFDIVPGVLPDWATP